MSVTEVEVEHAWRRLFGGQVDCRQLKELTWARDLKATFRRRAFEVHPDRAQALGRSEADLTEEFKAVTEAHDLLARLAEGVVVVPLKTARGASSTNPTPTRSWRRTPAPPRPPQPTGPVVLPPRSLKLGEYLLHSRRINWSALIDALVWQRRQRPLLGQLAVEWGYVSAERLSMLIASRRHLARLGEPMGEYLVRRGALSKYQLLALVGRQRWLQQPLGAFFVERGLVERADLEQVLVAQRQHNLRHR